MPRDEEKHRRYNRDKRKTRAAQGLCTECGDSPPVEGRKLCSACASWKNDVALARLAAFKEKNICRKCQAAPPELGKQSCTLCLRADADRMTAKRNAFLGQGLCGTCGKHPLVNKSVCEHCLVAQTARSHGLTPEVYLALLEAGCTICGSREDLHVDHDHACCNNRRKNGCGKCVRGALCRTHNTHAGWLEHPDTVKMLEYLASTRSSCDLVALFAAVHDAYRPNPLR